MERGLRGRRCFRVSSFCLRGFKNPYFYTGIIGEPASSKRSHDMDVFGENEIIIIS